MNFIEAKVVVLGGQGVGKTSIVMRYLDSNFSRYISPTIGASFFSCDVVVDGSRVRLQIWDTAGQERFRAMAPMYYRNANASILVFDIACEESFHRMKSWVAELKKNVDEPIVLCILGNKRDLEEFRQVSTQEALTYAQSIDAIFYETSAITNEGIEDAFCELGSQLVESFALKKERNGNGETNDRDIISLHSDGSRSPSKTPDDERSFLCC